MVAAGFSLCNFAYATGLSRVNPGAQAPTFSAQGADGKRHRLRDYSGKLVVLEWTNPVCPFTAVKYKNGAMQALQRYAASHDVVWLSIDTAAPDKAGYLTAAAARAHCANSCNGYRIFVRPRRQHRAQLWRQDDAEFFHRRPRRQTRLPGSDG